MAQTSYTPNELLSEERKLSESSHFTLETLIKVLIFQKNNIITTSDQIITDNIVFTSTAMNNMLTPISLGSVITFYFFFLL